MKSKREMIETIESVIDICEKDQCAMKHDKTGVV